ncbi:MAG: hypothetical protein GEV03_16655 [Streptosporangiales bacterium]|nr:hypothetical protein [Streptosporangiales bacterium]
MPGRHPGLRRVGAVRREMAVPTAFNLLGPLINPADPTYQVVGVADARMAPVIAEILAARGRSALVVRGQDGLDKLTTVTESRIWVVHEGIATPTLLDPRDLGISRVEPSALGNVAADNARVMHALLNGQRGPMRDVVLLNAAAALAATAPSTTNLPEQLAAGIARCAKAIDTGAANATLRRWIAVTHDTAATGRV